MDHPEYEGAEEAINLTADETGGSSVDFIRRLQERAEALEADERARVMTYISETRSALSNTVIADLPSGVGGLYDGNNVYVSTDNLKVGDSVEEAARRIRETSAHEAYHKTHAHTAPFKLGASAQGSTAVTIGGEAFDDTRVVEALTVRETGNEFVSQGYVEHERRFFSALVRASLTIDDARKAVNEKKDLGLLDDVSREQAADEPSLAA